MINITVYDKNDNERSEIEEQCKRYISEHEIDIDLKVCGSSAEVWVTKERMDILILDNTPPKVDAIKIKEELEKQDRRIYIIFTSKNDPVDEMFGINVSGFIRKPIEYSQLCREIDKILCTKEYTENIMSVADISDVEYVESAKPYIILHSVDGSKAIMRTSLTQFENEASSLFVRVSRKYLVNLAHIKTVTEKVLLDSGIRIEVSRDAKVALKRIFNVYLQKTYKKDYKNTVREQKTTVREQHR